MKKCLSLFIIMLSTALWIDLSGIKLHQILERLHQENATILDGERKLSNFKREFYDRIRRINYKLNTTYLLRVIQQLGDKYHLFVPRNILATQDSFTYSEKCDTEIQECGICFSNPEEDYLQLTTCPHIFCTNCLLSWYTYKERQCSGACPLCKIPLDDNLALYFKKNPNYRRLRRIAYRSYKEEQNEIEEDSLTIAQRLQRQYDQEQRAADEALASQLAQDTEEA